MLYAEFDRRQQLLPMKWDKCEGMYRYLTKLAQGYQFIAERKMFQTVGPEYRCVLVRWVVDNIKFERRREVLLETSDPTQMEVALFMLINEAEANKC
jgi:hypothetical protein